MASIHVQATIKRLGGGYDIILAYRSDDFQDFKHVEDIGDLNLLYQACHFSHKLSLSETELCKVAYFGIDCRKFAMGDTLDSKDLQRFYAVTRYTSLANKDEVLCILSKIKAATQEPDIKGKFKLTCDEWF